MIFKMKNMNLKTGLESVLTWRAYIQTELCGFMRKFLENSSSAHQIDAMVGSFPHECTRVCVNEEMHVDVLNV